MSASLVITSFDEIEEAVRTHPRLLPHGRQTKAPLIAEDPDALRLDMTGLTGVTEYEPGEFTFTAYAGTPIREIEELLAEHRQYMPFDPPLGEAGATIGGTLAAGVNGAQRLRYGGLRDFVIGVRFVDGTGRLVRGGGKVVKNSAGFDLPKLMVGSMGRLGVIAEVTFKVFPTPEAWRSIRISCRDLEDALGCLANLSRRPLETQAIELEPPATVVVRVGGDAAGVDPHARRVGELADRPHEILTEDADADYWRAAAAFSWASEAHQLVKVPLTLKRIPGLEQALPGQAEVPRRYGVAGNVAWVGWPVAAPLSGLDLDGLGGLVVRGTAGTPPWTGTDTGEAGPFADRVKSALDPDHRFPALA